MRPPRTCMGGPCMRGGGQSIPYPAAMLTFSTMHGGFQAPASGCCLAHAWGATPCPLLLPLTCPAMLIPSISKPATVRVWARLAAAASPLDEAWEVTAAAAAAAAGAGGGRAATGVAAVGLAPASALRRFASILSRSVLVSWYWRRGEAQRSV